MTVLLQSILKHCFPEESAARERELQGSSAQRGAAAAADLPIFVMAPMLPGEKIALNIFEPRYRLMVRRCVQGDRRLGMTCAVMVLSPSPLPIDGACLVCHGAVPAAAGPCGYERVCSWQAACPP